MAHLRLTPRDLAVAGVAMIGLAIAISAATLLSPKPTIIVPAIGGAQIIGVKVSHDETRLHTDQSDPLTFNVVEFESGGDFFDESRPDRLTVPVTGCYLVQAQITVLGSDYNLEGVPGGGNPESPDFIIEIKKNGDPDEFVASDFLSDENPRLALLNHTGSLECFVRGEYIQVFVTGDRVIESNWPDSDGSVSPVLYMVYVGALP
jgi:hypothetical protein